MSICGLHFPSRTRRSAPSMAPRRCWRRSRKRRPRFPSAIFYEADGGVDRPPAVEAYVEGVARPPVAKPQSVLGTSLIDETTRLDASGQFPRRNRGLCRRDETPRGQATGRELTHVVHGRRFTSSTTRRTPTARRRTPCAPSRRASGSRRSRSSSSRLPPPSTMSGRSHPRKWPLIADIGGGTSDFSIVRLGPERHGKADRAGRYSRQ